MKGAFSLSELVFVIVVLGILSGIAVSKIFTGRDDAVITKTRAEITAILSGISLKYSENLLSANPTYPQKLDSNELLFSEVLPIGIKDANNKDGWSKNGENYTFKYKENIANFRYDSTNGKFECISGNFCDTLIKIK